MGIYQMLVKGIEMKKIMFLGGVVACSVTSATSGGDPAAAAHSADTFNGIYVGAGIVFGHTENKASVTWNSFGANCPEIACKKGDQFGASTALGYGWTFSNNVYVGGEFLVDVCENKAFSGTYEWHGKVPYNGKIKGIIPSIALRLGYYVNPIETMVYLRAGAAYVKADFYDSFVDGVVSRVVGEHPNVSIKKYGQHHNISCIVPIVGVGVEKKFGAYGVRLEGDYRINTSKDYSEGCDIARDNVFRANVRSRVNDYAVRLMATYNFR